MHEVPVYIYYTQINHPFDESKFDTLIQLIPEHLHKDIKKYIQPIDRIRTLLGKLLLLHCLKVHNWNEYLLLPIHFTRNNRPFFKGAKFDFNISHSGDFILCAITEEGSLGVDIEQINVVELEDFNSVMTPEQIQFIKNSTRPETEFFKLWSLKESVVKAVGKGLSIPLNELRTDYRTVFCENKTWFIHPLDIHDKYRSYLATDQASTNIRLTEVKF